MISQISSVRFFVSTLLYVGSWITDGYRVCSKNWGVLKAACSVWKNITVCNANANSPEAAKFHIFAPAQCNPGRMPPSPLSRHHCILQNFRPIAQTV